MRTTARRNVTTHETCAVCDEDDLRALTFVRLAGGGRATLCGSHALMHDRSEPKARTPAELRASLRDRRGRERRATEIDTLAADLTAAFAGNRRAGERRVR